MAAATNPTSESEEVETVMHAVLQTVLEDDEERFDCLKCDKPNSYDNMVKCDNCNGWYHLSCGGVSPGVEKRRWHCEKCPPLPLLAGKESGATQKPKKLSKSDVDAKSNLGRRVTRQTTALGIFGDGKTLLCNPTTPLKNPEISQPKSKARSSRSSTSSTRARNQLAMKQLEETRKLEEEKIREEERRLEEDRAMQERERTLRRKKIEMKEHFLKKSLELEEEALEEDDNVSEYSSLAGSDLKQKWLDEQRERNAKGPDAANGDERKEDGGKKGVGEGNEKKNPSAPDQPRPDPPRPDPPRPDPPRPDPPGPNPPLPDPPGPNPPLPDPPGPNPPLPDPPGPNPPLPNPPGQDPPPEEEGVVLTPSQIASRKVWPKKHPDFAGDPDEWPIFYSSFELATKACGLTNVENILRLRDCLKGEARRAVYSKLMFPDEVPAIIATLKRTFGKPKEIVKGLMEKVRKLVPPDAEDLKALRDFGLEVTQMCDQLVAAGLRNHLTNPTLLDELVAKLPAAYKMQWAGYQRQYDDPTLKEFGMFMDSLVMDISEVVNSAGKKPNAEKSKPGPKGHVCAHSSGDAEREHSGGDSARQQWPCPICEKPDCRPWKCGKFLGLDLKTRMEAVENSKLCEVCLIGHGKWKCKSKLRCKVVGCNERHNTLLHGAVVTATCHTHGRASSEVLFKVIPVTVHNEGQSIETFAFVDDGSSLTLIEAKLAKRLGLNGPAEPLKIVWTSDVERTEQSSQRVDVVISARDGQQRHCLKGAHTVKNLHLFKQSLALPDLGKRFKHLEGLDALSYVNAEPQMLIGVQDIDIFAPLETRIGQPGEPIAVRSLLGWTVYGPSECKRDGKSFIGVHYKQQEVDDELNKLVLQQFVLDEALVSATPLPESRDDLRARSILEKTTRRIGDRFETGLIWKSDDIRFPDSWAMATRRLKALEAKLSRDPDLQTNVFQQIRDYVTKGYAHIATEEELAAAEPERIWYLPINVVTHPKKPEKKRLVWDAAARVDGVSLNSMLMKGPDLLRSLPSVICKFRERPIAFGGDVREMFHQVRIIPRDKHSQRFIFRFDPHQQPDIYMMDVATFGATCSPCSVQYVMHKNALECDEFPEAAAAIIEKTYMDDYFDSVDTPEEAAERAVQVRAIHARGGFVMRNWVSNCEKVLIALGETRTPKPSAIGSENEDGWERVLGLIWNSLVDLLTFSTKFHGDLKMYMTGEGWPTKRIVARCVMSLFDPTGLLAPYLIHGKMLIQDLWRAGTQWDQRIPDEEYQKWASWVALLPGIAELKIPRYYFNGTATNRFHSIQLHVFTDASELGLGCAAYLRAVADDGIHCALVMGKSKVASIKYQSIPRRELQAASLGARMAARVREWHTISIDSTTFWTDSTTVLSWIRSDNRRYKPFVANQLGIVLSHSDPEAWRWVPTKENVADCLTKWGKDSEPDINNRWFHGPSFLYAAEEDWPRQRKVAVNIEEELRPQYLLHHHGASPECLPALERISKWNILVRTISFAYRFLRNCRLKAKGQPIETVQAVGHQQGCVLRSIPTVHAPLTQDEYEKAEQFLWRAAQAECFPDEVATLLKNRDAPIESLVSIDKSSPIYNRSPFADEFGVLRVDGRTANAGYAAFDARFPVLLPKKHRITFLVLDHYHRLYGHANRETVVNEVRQRYEIPSLRPQVRAVGKSCQWCKVQKTKPQPPRMAPLPEQRLTPYIRPFSYVGIDYLGPLEVTVGRRKEKRYVALFTCLVVRAVHLEVTHSLSTDACMMAIRRFVRTHGPPVEIFTDNGTNFVGASRELLREIKRINSDCADTFTNAKTNWSFNPPSAPHMGGVWERMVRSVKETMRALDDGRKLNDEILLTVLAETKWFINSRPLTYMPQKPGDEEAITPNHFLLWGTSSGVQEPLRSPVDLAEALRNSYKRSQFLADNLWKRWLKEYFPTLNKRSKWFNDVPAISVGDLVYVAEGNRRNWIRGKIEEVFPGPDGRIRQAAVRTSSNQRLLRPVVKLAVIEIKDGEPGK